MSRARRAFLALGALAALGAAAPAEHARVHPVQAGETLWSIAETEMGDGALWPALYRANRDQIKNPAVVYPGQRLEIPAIDDASRESILREGRTPPH